MMLYIALLGCLLTVSAAESTFHKFKSTEDPGNFLFEDIPAARPRIPHISEFTDPHTGVNPFVDLEEGRTSPVRKQTESKPSFDFGLMEGDSSDRRLNSKVSLEEPVLRSNLPQIPLVEPVLRSRLLQMPVEEPVLRSRLPQMPVEEPVLRSSLPQMPLEDPIIHSRLPQMPSEEPVLRSSLPQIPLEEPVLRSEVPQTPLEEPVPRSKVPHMILEEPVLRWKSAPEREIPKRWPTQTTTDKHSTRSVEDTPTEPTRNLDFEDIKDTYAKMPVFSKNVFMYAGVTFAGMAALLLLTSFCWWRSKIQRHASISTDEEIGKLNKT